MLILTVPFKWLWQKLFLSVLRWWDRNKINIYLCIPYRGHEVAEACPVCPEGMFLQCDQARKPLTPRGSLPRTPSLCGSSDNDCTTTCGMWVKRESVQLWEQQCISAPPSNVIANIIWHRFCLVDGTLAAFHSYTCWLAAESPWMSPVCPNCPNMFLPRVKYLLSS